MLLREFMQLFSPSVEGPISIRACAEWGENYLFDQPSIKKLKLIIIILRNVKKVKIFV